MDGISKLEIKSLIIDFSGSIFRSNHWSWSKVLTTRSSRVFLWKWCCKNPSVPFLWDFEEEWSRPQFFSRIVAEESPSITWRKKIFKYKYFHGFKMFTLTLLHVVYSGCERTQVLVLSCLAVVFHLSWKKNILKDHRKVGIEFTFSSRIATSGTLMLNVNFVFQQGLNPLSLTGFVAGFGSPLKSSLWPLKITWTITILDNSIMLMI